MVRGRRRGGGQDEHGEETRGRYAAWELDLLDGS